MSAVKKRSQRRSDPLDVHVGHNIRARRGTLGLSRQQLAARLGIAVQQLYKYETGVNRIAASRLYEIARVLGIGVGHLFAGLDDTTSAAASIDWELAVAFNRVACRARRRALLALVLSLADDHAGGR